MRVLMCHNFYRLPGGEDQVYHDESWLLESFGHHVFRMERHNRSIEKIGALQLTKTTLWSREAYEEISGLIRAHRPHVVHFHNTFPLISPSGYDAARRQGVPVVQTLHNFRPLCPAAALLRDHVICEKCATKRFAWPGIVHGCYRNSRKATAMTAVSSGFHRLRGTWQHRVDRFISLTQHSRNKFIASGFPGDKISVKPNFVRPDPGASSEKGSDIVFVGRLSTEKGIDTLLRAWQGSCAGVPLRIIGDGPLRDHVVRAREKNPVITWLGQLPFEDVLREIGRARALVFPSIWYETFGRSMIEAFAAGTPVIASDLGAMKELVEDGVTGFHFRTGDASDLADKVLRICSDQMLFAGVCEAARCEYEKKYTAETNYKLLIDIYQQAIAESATREEHHQ